MRQNNIQPINPHLLDIVRRETDYVLYYSRCPLKTPAGKETAHRDPRVLEHILRDLSLSRVLDPRGLNAYALFCASADFSGSDVNHGIPFFGELFRADPIIKRKSQRTGKKEPEKSALLLDDLGGADLMSFYFSGFSGALNSLNDFLRENGSAGLECIGNSLDEFMAVIKKIFFRQSPEKRAASFALCAAHEAGIILPLMLVTQKINASEYANALFSIHHPFAGRTKDDVSSNDVLPPRFRKTPMIPDWNTPRESFAELREQASRVMEYLFCCERKEGKSASIRELIGLGEHFGLEFKSSLRWNLKAGRKDPDIEHACLKTIAAFLNSSGGKLLIGVRDDGSIEGIETDGFAHTDKFALHFWNLVKSRMGQEICPFIGAVFEKIDGKTVFAVDCAASPSPVFLNQKQGEDEFYIRVGPSSAKLTVREALKYIAQRFEKQHDAISAG